MQILQSVGGRLMLARKNKGWSQLDLLEQLKERKGIDITPAHWSRVEGMKRGASLELLIAAAELLDVSLDYLVHGEGVMEYA
jgi:transcriptional regulator with XRE-family HTH domain